MPETATVEAPTDVDPKDAQIATLQRENGHLRQMVAEKTLALANMELQFRMSAK